MEAQSKGRTRVYYFTPYDILRPRTNQISDVRFCEGFAQNDCEVTLVAPYSYRKDNLSKKDVLRFYGVEQAYRVLYLPTFFWGDIEGKWQMFLITLLNVLLFLRISLGNVFRGGGEVLLVSRSQPILYPMLVLTRLFNLRSSIITWVHEIKNRPIYRYVYQKSDLVLGTNSAITSDLNKDCNVPTERLGVTLNPITEKQLANPISKEQARTKIGINATPLIVYTGKLYRGQPETQFILNAAKKLPQYTFLLTGGKPEVIEHINQWCADSRMDNVHLTGYLYDYTQLQDYQYAADVLLSYYSPKEHDVRYNLPQKIIEYMLTKSPIVTPDFPATKDVLNVENAIFVEPENEESLVEGIKRAVEDAALAAKVANQAYADAQGFTFKKIIKGLLKQIKETQYEAIHQIEGHKLPVK